MIKIITIIGARPQIIKAAALSRAIRNTFIKEITEIIVHTGQHYDEKMSEVFFEELSIPKPNYNLNVGSSNHGTQTAQMIKGIEEILLKEKPDYIVLYGDTNSTLAGAIAASKINISIVHIEAGLRSYNKAMPEEINRIMCDHVSTLLFSPTKTGYKNLLKEGFKENKPPYNIDNPGIYHCGDIMYDNSLYFSEIAEKKSSILPKYQLKQNEFILGTIHRNNNTDDPKRLNAIFEAINKISESERITIVLPLHPRTNKVLQDNLDRDTYIKTINNHLIKIIPPVSFLDMILLEKNSEMIITDSGGVQKEAFFFQKPCIIIRSESEWVEIIDCGLGIIADADKSRIYKAFKHFKEIKLPNFNAIFGKGNAAEFICNEMIVQSKNKKVK